VHIAEETQQGFYTHMLSDVLVFFPRLSFQKHCKQSFLALWVSPITIIFTLNAKAWAFTRGKKAKSKK
jgi:hypothetical protein